MKALIYKTIYNPGINSLLRPLARLVYRLAGKQMIAVSGEIGLKVNDTSFRLRTNQSSFVMQDLYFKGPLNYEFTPLFIDLISSEKVFLDIGANIGYFSVLGSKLNPDCQIFAFEPSVGSLHFLRQNAEINGCKNVHIIDKAVSNIDGTLSFHEITNRKFPWLKYNLNGSNSLESGQITADFRTYDVQVTTIESVVNQHHLESIGLIKLDTECTEHMILDCSVETINKYRPLIICEVYPVIEKEVENILKHKMAHYQIYQYLQESNTLKPFSAFSDISHSDPDRNFVFCPAEKSGRLSKYIQGSI